VKKLPITLALIAVTIGLLGVSPVAAHQSIDETSISISADRDSIRRGQQVKIRGELDSRDPTCFDRERVTLFVDGVPVKSKDTRPNGKFNFKVRPAATGEWHVEYEGKMGGRHPHVHVCLASTSNVITIEVSDN